MRLPESDSTTGGPPPAAAPAPGASPRPGPARDVFDALADGHRREILRMLHEGDRSVNELAAGLPISRPAVSRHLKLLSDAGLVAERRAGTRHIFHLRPEGARAVQDYLAIVWGPGRAESPPPEATAQSETAEPPA